jgi:2-keto-3-deoxy-L-rhamnonate aldolase RhmA
MVERCLRRIREHGRIGGTLTNDVECSRQVIEWGATYIVTTLSPLIIQGGGRFRRAARA